MVVPENNQDEFLIADDLILEYVRPCPPKCKTSVHFYELNQSTNTLEKKSTHEYGVEKPCMKSPFEK